MWFDPIVEEVRKRGDRYAAKFNYDLKAMGEDLRKKASINSQKWIVKKDEGKSDFERIRAEESSEEQSRN